ncbi:hypothetical protein NC652_011697 [Populus alba x Populus x berolinensis]|uniref:Uncharacterized protein n=1 Tax=Populus alba x Populus x berolinensis TaxID=444605 RepID=A0AAD6R335_9ROSI|nr:hypothetical protein NC652_011697 [Populus alba x Populus x berolinensis]KAJ7001440.1 hypothetical protein NC653_011763 [Populus alba x Populus x berolinensis]
MATEVSLSISIQIHSLKCNDTASTEFAKINGSLNEWGSLTDGSYEGSTRNQLDHIGNS